MVMDESGSLLHAVSDSFSFLRHAFLSIHCTKPIVSEVKCERFCDRAATTQKYQSQIGLVGLLNATAGTCYGMRHRMVGAWKRWSRGIHIG